MSLRAAITGGVIAAIIVTLVLALRIADPVELPVRDAAMRAVSRVSAQSTVVVAIDEPSISALGRWPWDRAVLAQIVNRIAGAQPRALVLDILLSESAPGDERLARALHRMPSIAVSALDRRGWLLPAPVIRNAVTPAHGIFERDHDGISRRLASTKQSGGVSLTAMSVEAASIVTANPVPVGRSIAPMFRARPQMIPAISAVQLLRNPAVAQRPHGKIVFLGPTAIAIGDRVLTPVSSEPDPGVTVHAAATESLIRGEEVRPIAPIMAGGIAGLFVGLVLVVRAHRRAMIVVSGILIVAVLGGGLLILAGTGFAIPFLTFTLSIAIVATLLETLRITNALRQSDAAVSRLTAGREQEAESKRVLAHELKTPLASMRGLSQLLAGFDLTDGERRRVASMLEAEAGKLQSMVGGLLDLERLPLRDFQSSTSVIDLGDIVRMRVSFLQASTDRTLVVSTAPDVTVRADPALIERVIDNLVGNALKYAPPPSPIMIATRTTSSGAVIEVEDRGPGLNEAERERVFHRFFRASSAAGTPGLGLGLSLVAEVAKWHGGSVAVESPAEGGSLFRFTLPVASAVAKAGAM